RNRSTPSFASATAMARPMPEPAPVTNAFLPRITRIALSVKQKSRRGALAGFVDFRSLRPPMPTLGRFADWRFRQRLAWCNDPRKWASFQAGRRNRAPQAVVILSPEQGTAPLVEVVLAAVVHAAIPLFVRVGRHVGRNDPHVERQPVLVGRIRPRTVD